MFFEQLLKNIDKNLNLKCFGLKVNSSLADLREFFGNFTKFLGQVESLDILHLSLWNQKELSDADFILLLGSIRRHTKLRSLRLDFSRAVQLTDASIVTLLVLIERFKYLENICLGFSFIDNISEDIVITVINTLERDFQTLVSLGLLFMDNRNLTRGTVKALNSLLQKLENLRYLMVYMNSIDNIHQDDLELFKQLGSRLKKNDYNLGSIQEELYVNYSLIERF